MKQGPELFRWAQDEAVKSVAADVLAKEARPHFTALAIAEAYVKGATDALADEIERQQAKRARA